MAQSNTDRIEKKVMLRAPLSRVWRAISDAKEFGQWFRVDLAGEFAAGAAVRGQVTYPGYEHMVMELQVERIEPESYFSFRWHPYEVDLEKDYSAEPTTLVEFRLKDVSGGTELTITESGFDRIPGERRDEAFRSNDQGWSTQVQHIEAHVTRA